MKIKEAKVSYNGFSGKKLNFLKHKFGSIETERSNKSHNILNSKTANISFD